MPKWFLSELAGTFVLVFFGTGVVATSIAFDAPVGLFQIAAVWGCAVTAAIFLSAHHSGAHINPAITLAFAAFTDFPKKRVPGYIAAQFIGAFLAACAVSLLFNNGFAAFEEARHITRGTPESVATAKSFGEFYAAPITTLNAFGAEFIGTLLLAFAVFGFIAKGNESGPAALTPLAIGLTLTALICVLAPISQGGFNPARDLAPRLFSSLAGWGKIPFSTNGHAWLTVYVIAPCLGSLCGGFLATRLFRQPDRH